MGVDLGYIDQKQQEIAAAQAARAIGGVPFWSPADGKSTIRLLGPWSDKVRSFERAIDMHFGVGPEEQVFTCPGPGCPICAHVAALRATNDPGDQELAGRISKKKRYYSNVVDLTDPVWTKKDYDEWKAGSSNQADEPSWRIGQTKVQVFGYGSMIYSQLINLFAALHKDLTDLAIGHDLIITKMGKQLNTKYTVILDPVAKPLEVRGELMYHQLDALSPPKQAADMVAALSGQPHGAIPASYGAQPAAMAPPPAMPAPVALPPAHLTQQPATTTGRTSSAAPNVAQPPRAPAQVQQLGAPAPAEEAPPCFKDKTTFSTTDAECIGGQTADGQHMDKCPFYQECGEFSGKLAAPAKGRRRGSKAAEAAPATNDADALEQQMQEALRG